MPTDAKPKPRPMPSALRAAAVVVAVLIVVLVLYVLSYGPALRLYWGAARTGTWTETQSAIFRTVYGPLEDLEGRGPLGSALYHYNEWWLDGRRPLLWR